MKLRKILAVLLALVLTLGTTAFAADTFSDVPEDAYYAEAAAWAAEKKIAEGRGNGVFDPEATVTRAEAVTFLWRMAGEPEPTQTETFADVESDPENWWYKTAVQWAVEMGITNGMGDGKFCPTVPCSRGMILTMLYRMNDCPLDGVMETEISEDPESWTLEDIAYMLVQSVIESIRGEDGFTDLKEGEYYELPMIWAMLNGILDENQIDTESRSVQPNAPCLRGEMVYFLYYASGEAPVKGAVEVGTIPETVVLDKDGAKITVNGIANNEYGGAELSLTFENDSAYRLSADVSTLYVNTFSFTPSVYVLQEDGSYEYDVVAEPGETMEFCIGLNSFDEYGITRIHEIELTTYASIFIEYEDGSERREYADGEAVTIRTDLYDESASYDLEGTTVLEKDGLTLRVSKAENDEFMGPDIAVYAYNGGSEDAILELAELKLDGETYEAYLSLEVPAGKRVVSSVYVDGIDDENAPAFKEGEITFRTLDPETWEPALTFEPAAFTFAD